MIKKKQKRKKNERVLEGRKKRNNILLHVKVTGRIQKSSFLFIIRNDKYIYVYFSLILNLLINRQTSTDNEECSSQGKKKKKFTMFDLIAPEAPIDW